MDKEKIKLDLLKIKFKDLISKKILNLLIENIITFKEIQNMAIDITETLDYINNSQQFLLFIDKLPDFYPYLKAESKLMSVEMSELKEKIVINKLENYFKILAK